MQLVLIAIVAIAAQVVQTLTITTRIAALGDIAITMIGGVTETINGVRGMFGERVHAVGDTGLPNVTLVMMGGTIITVGKITGMIRFPLYKRGRYHQAAEENFSRSPSPRHDLSTPLNRKSDATDKPLSN